QAAADRQRAELSRTSAYAHSIGCDNQKFLFFGSEPPAQCSEIKGQIARMQANLADLQARSGGGGGRADLIARYNSECVNAPKQPTNIFEALFGGARPPNPFESTTPASIPMSPDEQQETIEKSIENEKKGANAHAGSYAVCVRTCDGSFFPVSYSGAGSRADSLEEVCRSLCPNADVALYSFPLGGTIDQAVSSTGERYVDMPNALKFQQSFDSTCSCRRRGESWAQALANAEARYGHESHDILVTPEKSAELSRPIVPKTAADPKARPPKTKAADSTTATVSASPTTTTPAAATTTPDPTAPVLDVNGANTALSAAAATVSREASGIAGGDTQGGTRYSESQGQTVTETGPDGVKRKVRIVGPTL
ncbi:MAG: DUF2865 domain-containing protein, partial [Hyphomicrobiales bacterium]|nr:DUF2865 domain-containing protein [Hyphomicrobiales bacterium]